MYSDIYANFLFPLYESVIRRRHTLRYLKEAEDIQWKSGDQLKAIQWSRLKSLLEHAYANSPYYKKVFVKAGLTPGDIETCADFRKLPTISKDDIRKNRDEMAALNYLNKKLTKATGGSTGIPLEFDYDRNSYERRTAIYMRNYGWLGCRDGIKTAYIWGEPIMKPSFSRVIKSSVHDFVRRRLYLNAYVFTEKEMVHYLKKINTFKPKVIVAYTTPMYNFAMFIREKGLRCVRPQSIVTVSEALLDHQRDAIEEIFGCKVYETYGSREFMVVASECDKQEGLHINIDQLYVEFLKDDKPAKPGETGEIAITDLHNYAMPFIRYKLGDMGSYTDKMCSCGRGLPLMEGAVGRKVDTLQTPDGRIIAGVYFPQLFKEFNEIKKFQVVQERIDLLSIKIVKRSEFNSDRLNLMRQKARDIMGSGVDVNFQFVEDIIVSSSGKYRVVTSKIPVKFKGDIQK